MSLFKSWRFRSARPSFQPGDELTVYLTAFDEQSGRGEARIGDSILEVSGARSDQVDKLVTLRVEAFEAGASKGRAVVA